jgi:hypothetical protein
MNESPPGEEKYFFFFNFWLNSSAAFVVVCLIEWTSASSSSSPENIFFLFFASVLLPLSCFCFVGVLLCKPSGGIFFFFFFYEMEKNQKLKSGAAVRSLMEIIQRAREEEIFSSGPSFLSRSDCRLSLSPLPFSFIIK